MTKTKTILAALALTTALTAPVLIVPLLSAPAAVAAAPTMSGVQDFSDLAAKVTPAVVNVAVTMKAGADDSDEIQMSDRSRSRTQMEEFMQRFAERFGQKGMPQVKPQRPNQKAQAVGTGFIIDAKGWIVTNYHVAGKADSITVTLTDGRKLPAKMVGGDEKTDLALLKVESDKPLPFVSFGDATKVRVGQAVMAVGNPFGLGGTVTTGIVSARGRDIQLRSVRRLHPDRRRHQPRQLGRSAVRHGRQRDRHQHGHLLADRRQYRPGLRHPVEPGRAGGGPAQDQRPGRARPAGRADPAGDRGTRQEHVARRREGRPGGPGDAGQPGAGGRHPVG